MSSQTDMVVTIKSYVNRLQGEGWHLQEYVSIIFPQDGRFQCMELLSATSEQKV
jgi:hypothetical protein